MNIIVADSRTFTNYKFLMADNTDMLIAFWNGTSKGTKHMIDIIHKQNKKVIIIKF